MRGVHPQNWGGDKKSMTPLESRLPLALTRGEGLKLGIKGPKISVKTPQSLLKSEWEKRYGREQSEKGVSEDLKSRDRPRLPEGLAKLKIGKQPCVRKKNLTNGKRR